MENWPCRYCENLTKPDKPWDKWVGGCKFDLSHETCGKFELAKCYEGHDPRTADTTMPDVKRQVADWIDTEVIAENILDELADAAAEVTLENAKQMWLDFLACELHTGLKIRAEGMAERYYDEQLPEKPCDDGSIAV